MTSPAPGKHTTKRANKFVVIYYMPVFSSSLHPPSLTLNKSNGSGTYAQKAAICKMPPNKGANNLVDQP